MVISHVSRLLELNALAKQYIYLGVTSLGVTRVIRAFKHALEKSPFLPGGRGIALIRWRADQMSGRDIGKQTACLIPSSFKRLESIDLSAIEMKFCSLAVIGLSTTVVALSTSKPDQTILGNDDQDLYLVELSPGERRWIAEDEKWALRRVCNYHRL